MAHSPLQRHRADAVMLHGVRLTAREWSIAQLIGEARGNKEIAASLGLTQGTVGEYLLAIYAKMRVVHPEIAALNCRVVLAQWVANHER